MTNEIAPTTPLGQAIAESDAAGESFEQFWGRWADATAKAAESAPAVDPIVTAMQAQDARRGTYQPIPQAAVPSDVQFDDPTQYISYGGFGPKVTPGLRTFGYPYMRQMRPGYGTGHDYFRFVL